MDIQTFTQMLSDKHFTDLKRLKYKYPDDFEAFIETLKALYYKELPVANDLPVVYVENYAGIDIKTLKLLLRPQSDAYGIKAAEEEISASSAIENIDFNRDSIRNILKGLAPKDDIEDRILGQKKGLEFISDPRNKITEANLHQLYMMMVGDFLTGEDRLMDGAYYRHDIVYVVSDHIEHAGVNHKKLPEYMRAFIAFINADDRMDDLLKAAAIHFYMAYLHPYFDGNGRMSRMLHLWFLIQKGYQTALFVPLSSYIASSRKTYYRAFTAAEENSKLSGVLDITPFLKYFADEVYNKLPQIEPRDSILARYKTALDEGQVTPKEAELWRYVLSRYGTEEFSTKQLERDFQQAAYATVRNFVLKFQRLGLLSSTAYGQRIKYQVKPY